jgi:hypothetical protein
MVEEMSEADLLDLITVLLDRDGPVFDFVKVDCPGAWVYFVLSLEINEPSRMYLDALHDNCVLILKSLMTIDSERQGLLALI